MSRYILPELPEEWTSAPIVRIATIVYGEALRAEERTEKGGIPVYGSGGILGEHNQSLHIGPSIIIGRKGTVGAIHYVPGPFWCIDTAFYLDNIHPSVDIEFLAYVLDHLNLSRLTIVVGVPGISRKDIESVPIPIPPPSEQRRIVSILREAGELQRLRLEANDIAQKLMAALFKQMFGSPNTTWEECKLSEIIASLEPGKSIQAKEEPAREGKWGVLKVSAVTYGRFLPEQNKELPDNYAPDPAYEVKEGDLLISRANTEELVGASAPDEYLPDEVTPEDERPLQWSVADERLYPVEGEGLH
jgi:type I restriction enzyme, S subunit